MQQISTSQKAFEINVEPKIYGTFAEIGAGQEVARQFFEAGKASGTVAKTISAYDMVFSDAIYGKEKNGRYVCQSRLEKMLCYEFDLLIERLQQVRGDKSCFFSFANTVTTGSVSRQIDSHGWIGVRFQLKPNGPVNQIVAHIKMKNRSTRLQREALGIVGVNLIYAAFKYTKQPEQFILSLIDNLDTSRIEIDMIDFSGEDLKHIDNRLMSLKLVANKFTNAALFSPAGKVLHIADELFKKSLVLLRGSFSPVTNIHVDMIASALKHNQSKPLVFLELTIHDLIKDETFSEKDFLERVDVLQTLGYPVLISNFFLFFELKVHMEKFTSETISMVMGANLLPKLFEEKYYTHVKGGMLAGIGQLTQKNSEVLIYPFKKSTSDILTLSSYNPDSHAKHIFQHLKEKNVFQAIDCLEKCQEIHSENVLSMIAKKDASWEDYVPKQVANLIKDRKLFGYK
jgi:nicotinic acid mononucleotide adenylyltransferase